MAFVEAVVHGWDLVRATGRQFEVRPAVGVELRRILGETGETGEMGRTMGAYGDEISVDSDDLA